MESVLSSYICKTLKNNIVNCDFTELNLDIGNSEEQYMSLRYSLELLDIILNY